MAHLHGKRIFLREYREEDFGAVRAWVNDPEVSTNLSPIFDRVHTEAMTREYFDKVMKNELPGHNMIIAHKDDGRYLGQIDLRMTDDPSRQAALAIVIPDPANRGKGYGREAMTILLDFGFDRLNLHKIWLEVFARNESAIHLYESLGFRKDGVLREDVYREGKYIDMILMSILDREWRAARS